MQFLTRYGNGGLYYRSSRDGVGFENEYEKIITEKAAQLKVVFQLMEFQILAIFLQQGTLLQVVLQEARLILAGTNRYLYLNAGSWGYGLIRIRTII